MSKIVQLYGGPFDGRLVNPSDCFCSSFRGDNCLVHYRLDVYADYRPDKQGLLRFSGFVEWIDDDAPTEVVIRTSGGGPFVDWLKNKGFNVEGGSK